MRGEDIIDDTHKMNYKKKIKHEMNMRRGVRFR